MNILFIMNGVGEVDGFHGISGGDVRWIEIAKRWQKNGHEIHVLTPEVGIKLCRTLGLNATFHIFDVPNDYSLKTYILRFMKSTYIPKTLENFHGIVYSITEHVYDVYPAAKIKENNKDNIWVAVVHWIAPLHRKGTSLLNGILFFFNQQMGLRYIKKRSDLVLAVSKITSENVKRKGIKHNVFSVDCGVTYQEIRQVAAKINNKQYDAIFMKRFDGTKGVFDIIEIWKEVVKTKHEAKLGMIGLGKKEVMERLREMVENYNIENNVDFLGPIYDFETKFSLLASSKLFVLPSYEENWAIVIGEAMAAAVPVLCYDLPEIRPIWEDKVVWIPKGDKRQFANEIIELLNDEQSRNRLAEAGIQFIKKYDWQRIADEEIKLILPSSRTLS